MLVAEVGENYLNGPHRNGLRYIHEEIMVL